VQVGDKNIEGFSDNLPESAGDGRRSNHTKVFVFSDIVASRPECNRIHRARESWALSWHCLDFIFVPRLETSVTLSGSSVIPELYVCDESSVGRPSVPEGG
jgi:hypothetical protein